MTGRRKFNLHFLSKKKKGDEVGGDEDDDVGRTSVSQDRMSISVSGAHMISSPASLEPVQAVKK